MSADAKAQAIRKLDAQYLVDQKKQADEIKRLNQQKAIADRTAAILRVIENTAIAVTGALGDQDYPLAAVSAATGALQLAAVMAAPMPQYAEGTPDGGHLGGKALIGEGGKSELVTLPSGQKFIAPPEPKVYDLPKGTEVLPLETVNENFMKMVLPYYGIGTQYQQNGITEQQMNDIMRRSTEATVTALSLNPSFRQEAMPLGKHEIQTRIKAA